MASLMVSCGDDKDLSRLDNVQVSKSYISIPTTGGSEVITVNANGEWAIRTKDAKGVEKDSIPAWLTITPAKGQATGGEGTQVAFKAEATTKTNSTVLYLSCNGETQRLEVVQQAEKAEVPLSTCAQVNAGPDGNTYKVKGAVTSIKNTTYGNLYINDGTGEVYIYGTLDATGAEKNFSSLGIEVGDEITVEGPKETYNGTVELKNVTVVSIEKSLVKVDSLSAEKVGKEGGELVAYLTVKGDGVSVDIPEAAQSWLSLKSLSTQGTTAKVTFKVAANAGGERTAELVFKTVKDGKDYSSTTSFAQEGSIVPLTIAEFNAAEIGSAVYRLTGVITKVANATYGNVYIADYSGQTYVYGIGSKGDFEKLGLQEGDIVTITGQRSAYNGTIQVKGAQVETSYSISNVPALSVADFRNAAESKTQFYRVSGTVVKPTEENTKFDVATYGNFALKDETGEVYVYGLATGWNGESKQCGKIGIQEGDKITVIGYRTSYKGLVQIGGGFFYTKD